MKMKSLCKGLLASVFLFSTVSSYALDVYLRNSTLYPNLVVNIRGQMSQMTLGPILPAQTIHLSPYQTSMLENAYTAAVSFNAGEGFLYCSNTIQFAGSKVVSLNIKPIPVYPHAVCDVKIWR